MLDNTPPLVLASTSLHRRKILNDAGVKFISDKPIFKEDLSYYTCPHKAAIALAEGKGESLLQRYPNKYIISADQVGEIDGIFLSKATNKESAFEMIKLLSGNKHRLVTGVSIWDKINGSSLRKKISFSEETIIEFRTLSDEEINCYINKNEWVDCAGSYKVEAQGINLIKSIQGDYHNIIGLPIIRVLGVLRDLGLNNILL